MTSHGHDDVWNHRQHVCVCNRLLRLTSKRVSKPALLVRCDGKPSVKGPLLWRHNGHNSVSNHQPYDCLRRRLFRRRSKQTSKLRVTGLCAGNSPGPVNFPHKWPVTRKMFPFDDVIMTLAQSVDVLFDQRLNKRLSKKSGHRWFETPSSSLWRHCDVEKVIIRCDFVVIFFGMQK